MTTVKMNDYGQTLTDRADGKKASEFIMKQYVPPIDLDFSGVVALGSSFGDEVVLTIAPLQENRLRILNANLVIKNSLLRIIEGTPVTLDFEPENRS